MRRYRFVAQQQNAERFYGSPGQLGPFIILCSEAGMTKWPTPSLGTNIDDVVYWHLAEIPLALENGRWAADLRIVWTGRALQAENDDLGKVGLALLYPAYCWSG
jgi:hypothetical protein